MCIRDRAGSDSFGLEGGGGRSLDFFSLDFFSDFAGGGGSRTGYIQCAWIYIVWSVIWHKGMYTKTTLNSSRSTGCAKYINKQGVTCQATLYQVFGFLHTCINN